MQFALFFLLVVSLLAMLVWVILLFLKIKELRNNILQLEMKIQDKNLATREDELKHIRHKLNPHLFKNALNSIQSHAFQTYHAMDKLSGVLDYILYESDQQLTTLENELEFAFNFIEINRLKLSPLFDLRVKNSIPMDQLNIQQMRIMPLITVDLIENAFKHTDFGNNLAFIAIHLQLIENEFILEVTNRVSSREPLIKPHSGLGLINFKERLELAYPESHELITKSENEVFHAYLRLKLKEE
jgi:LytS/YehU family sensor histidine kinase